MMCRAKKVSEEKNGRAKKIESSMGCEGEDRKQKEREKTVGLPLAIACKQILEGKVNERGCILPTSPELYVPILEELEYFGVVFKETEPV